MKRISFFVILGLSLCGISVQAQSVVSIRTLLNEMVDRSALARFPDPSFTCSQSSSYDRTAVERDGEGWYANADYNQFVRAEEQNGRTEFVMMEAEGPGSIVRFWMTFNGENERFGTLRIYVDGQTLPVIEGPAWDVLSGGIVTGAPLSDGVSKESVRELRGHNLYLPIPYAKRCKVTYEYTTLKRDESGKIVFPGYVFYNINYRTYDPSVEVTPYSDDQMKRNRTLITQVQKQLADKERGIGRMKLTPLMLNATLAPGASMSFTIQGGGAIQQLQLQLEASNREQALRSTVLEIRFDGERTVWVPVGDFFGIGYRPLYTNTWYTQTDKAGMMRSFWVMPFRENCVVTLHNFGKESVRTINSQAGYGKWAWDERSMHFGTSWHLYNHTVLSRMIQEAGGECVDVNYAQLNGQGVYVGDAVALCNSSAGWWGEGDEKIFVDGETFPSHFGTGSEDYFGYAWCLGAPFTDHPFIAQPDGGGNNAPTFTVNTRLRELDAIPFRQSIDVNLEQYNRINYAPTAYWYMMPGGTAITGEDVLGASEKVAFGREDFYAPQLTLSAEAEHLTWVDASKGSVAVQSGFEDLWSGSLQVYWSQIQQGDRLTLGFESAYTGPHAFEGLFTLAPDYGCFNVYVNDKQVATSLNLYDKRVTTRTISLGEVELKQGLNTITFELTDYPKGMTGSCFGIDKITLVHK